MNSKLIELAFAGVVLGLATSVRAATVELSVSTVDELTNALATVTSDTGNDYVITLKAATYDLTTVDPMCATALLDVSTTATKRSLTIQGDSESSREDIVLDAKGTGRIIQIAWATEGSCTLKHLTLSNGHGGSGSAVYINKDSTYNFRDCVFRGNVGEGAGALTSANKSHVVEFYDCLIKNTYITGNYNGSLFSHPTLLSGCTFHANTNNCQQSKALIPLSSSATVTNCVFTENAIPGQWSTGGILRMSGGLVVCCAFTNNTASAGSGGGGALCLAGKTNVRKCTFHGNKYTASRSSGAAIYSTSSANSDAAISECEFTGNQATSTSSVGGAIGSFQGLITNCTFYGNEAYYGGAVYNCSNVVDCVFANNNSCGNTGSYGGGAAYMSVISDSVVTNNTAVYQAGGFYDCRVFRSVVGNNRATYQPTQKITEGILCYYEDCELIGGSPFGTCFNNCGFNRCYLHDYCSTNSALGNGYGYFIAGRIAITNCLFKNIYASRFVNDYAQDYDNAMINSTLVDCTYDVLAKDGKGDALSMAFVNNLFQGITAQSLGADDDDVGRLCSGMVFTNNFLYTTKDIDGSGNMNRAVDATLKPSLMLERDPEHPYAPRRRSVLVGAGVVQEWMADTVDMAGNARLADGKVSIGAYETTEHAPPPGMIVVVR